VSLLTAAYWCCGQNPSRQEQKIDIGIEQKHADAWSAADPRTVFKPGDEIRFVFRSTVPGYLYVLNLSPAGEYRWIYPAKDAGLENRVQAGARYLVPSTEGSFVMPDKPGFETLYWVLSPEELKSLDGVRTSGSTANTLLPRCSDDALKARGACVDRSAGAKPAGDKKGLPAPIAGANSLTARELSFEHGSESTQIRFAGMNDRAIVYEFWVAHR
jgi:hypothetical protein